MRDIPEFLEGDMQCADTNKKDNKKDSCQIKRLGRFCPLDLVPQICKQEDFFVCSLPCDSPLEWY